MATVQGRGEGQHVALDVRLYLPDVQPPADDAAACAALVYVAAHESMFTCHQALRRQRLGPFDRASKQQMGRSSCMYDAMHLHNLSEARAW